MLAFEGGKELTVFVAKELFRRLRLAKAQRNKNLRNDVGVAEGDRVLSQKT